jgi:hypothetical protein
MRTPTRGGASPPASAEVDDVDAGDEQDQHDAELENDQARLVRAAISVRALTSSTCGTVLFGSGPISERTSSSACS